MADHTHPDFAPHHEIEELLPWYATGQLEDGELRFVEQHLSGCAHCRRQLGFERRMIDEFAVLTPQIDAGWARLRARLDVPQHRRARQDSWESIVGRARALWRTLTRPSVAMFALAQISFVVLGAALLLSLARPSYRTLGSAPPPQSANAIAIFQSDTTESQLSQLLRSSGASIVAGPTPADAYLLRVPAVGRSAVLARLRSDRHVVMAEPIDRGSS